MTGPNDEAEDTGADEGRNGVRREVVEEDQEVIHVLEQGGLSLDERVEQEAGFLDEGDEVELSEKAWRKQADEDLDAIHEAVDAMEAPASPPGPHEDAVEDAAPGHDPAPQAPAPEPEPEPEPAPEPEVAPKDPTADLDPLTEVQKEALAEHVPGEMLTASPIYRTRRGQVVEVTYQDTGRVERTLLTLAGNEVRDLNAVAERVDAMETRARVKPASEAPDAEDAEDVQEEPEDLEGGGVDELEGSGGGLGSRVKGLFGRGDDEPEGPESGAEGSPTEGGEQSEPPEDEDDEPKATRGGLGSRVKGLFGGGDDAEEDAPEDEGGEGAEDPTIMAMDDEETPDGLGAPDEDDLEEGRGFGKRLTDFLRRDKDNEEPDDGS